MIKSKELLLGCGGKEYPEIRIGEYPLEEREFIRLDNNIRHAPDVLFDLNDLRGCNLPFPDNTFDVIHAYEVLEHLASQGDYHFFFREFEEYWRILKPDGIFVGSVPAPGSPWVWGDPSHTRQIVKENFTFLSQEEYRNQVGISPMSDFRYMYSADFAIGQTLERNDLLFFMLQAKKGTP